VTVSPRDHLLLNTVKSRLVVWLQYET